MRASNQFSIVEINLLAFYSFNQQVYAQNSNTTTNSAF